MFAVGFRMESAAGIRGMIWVGTARGVRAGVGGAVPGPGVRPRFTAQRFVAPLGFTENHFFEARRRRSHAG